jgi:hypothetical protein
VIATADMCSLFIDMPLGHAVAEGDWIATEAGSRYLVTAVRSVRHRSRHRQQQRYQLHCDRLPKDEPIPDDVHVIWLRWYAR